MPLLFNFKFGKNVKKTDPEKTTPQLLSNKLLKNAFTLFTCKNADTILAYGAKANYALGWILCRKEERVAKRVVAGNVAGHF